MPETSLTIEAVCRAFHDAADSQGLGEVVAHVDEFKGAYVLLRDVENGYLDSLEVPELVIAVEDLLGVEFSDDDLYGDHSLQNLLDIILARTTPQTVH